MDHRVIAIVLVLTVLVGAGCYTAGVSSQSSFFTKFSLRELFAKNEFSAGLDCSETSGGGGMSMGSGAVGKEQSNFSRLDTIACQITDAERFDEAKFLDALHESIVKDLSSYKATILGNNNRKPDERSFKLLYGLSDVSGSVEVLATRGPARFYTLKADLHEKSKPAQ